MIDRVAQRIEEMRRRPDLRNPDHVRRYDRLVVRNPDGSTEGVHPKDADPAVMGEIHMPLPIMKVIRAKCIDCSAGSEAEVRKCVAINCALWPYRMGSNQPLPHPDHLGRTSLTISGCCGQGTAGQGQAGAAPMTRAEVEAAMERCMDEIQKSPFKTDGARAELEMLRSLINQLDAQPKRKKGKAA